MKNLNEFNSRIDYVLTDIDDTLTTEGQLRSSAYEAIWKLHHAGMKVIPITGRPAGWCEMIARLWPVGGVIGENGGFYFRYASEKATSEASNAPAPHRQKKMHRWFFADEKIMKANQQKLVEVRNEILNQIPGSAVSSDQFSRLMDLAIDFCEDVTPLDVGQVRDIVQIFEKHGAQAKVSSIHVNGWFGDYNKLSTTLQFFKNEFQMNEAEVLKRSVYIGDSPNDEPMFQKFPNSFGVANVHRFASQMKSLPTYVARAEGGEGFSEITERIIEVQK